MHIHNDIASLIFGKTILSELKLNLESLNKNNN